MFSNSCLGLEYSESERVGGIKLYYHGVDLAGIIYYFVFSCHQLSVFFRLSGLKTISARTNPTPNMRLTHWVWATHNLLWWAGSCLVQMMDCRIFCAKLNLSPHELDHKKIISTKFELFQTCICIWIFLFGLQHITFEDFKGLDTIAIKNRLWKCHYAKNSPVIIVNHVYIYILA